MDDILSRVSSDSELRETVIARWGLNPVSPEVDQMAHMIADNTSTAGCSKFSTGSLVNCSSQGIVYTVHQTLSNNSTGVSQPNSSESPLSTSLEHMHVIGPHIFNNAD